MNRPNINDFIRHEDGYFDRPMREKYENALEKYCDEFETKIKLFNGWVEREEQSIKSELKATKDVEMVNYLNGRLNEIQIVKELEPRD